MHKMILLIGGEKGGSGKTTIATNLAVLFAKENNVLLIDADAQGSSNAWSDRREATPAVPCIQKTGKVSQAALEAAKNYDLVIIDAGGRDSAELRSSLLVCDLALFPLRPSQFDLESIPHLIELCEMASSMRTEPLKAGVVLTQCPTHHLVREEAEAAEAVKGAEFFSVCKARIHDRKAYRDAAIDGLGVIELSDEKASHEIQHLGKEVIQG